MVCSYILWVLKLLSILSNIKSFLMTVNDLWKPLVLLICLFKVDFSKESHTFYLSHIWVKHKSVWKHMLIPPCFSNILAHFPNGGIYFISAVFYLYAKKRIIAVLWTHILKNSSMQWSVYSQIYVAFLRFNFRGPLGTISNVQGVVANMKIACHVSNKND